MAQANFKDPIVSTSIVRTGTGNGSVSVDKLTHFTIAQTYTLTCISKTPDTVFSVSGSLDGPVGIATVGSQFFDEDLKIFLTITQGSTAFEVGDQFTFSVVNGTDLNQDNIDSYDERPQKNFGPGTKGTLSGEHNIHLSSDLGHAQAFIEGLKFTAVVAGETGNDIQIGYEGPVAGVQSTGTLQGLNFTSVAANAGANGITVSLLQAISPAKAEVTIQNVNYQAVNAGTAGNAITLAYTTGAVAGSEVVSVVGNAITVQIASGASLPASIVSKVNAHPGASALVFAKVTPLANTTPQTGPVMSTSLTGGVNSSGAAGFEVVTVVGQAISVRCETGVSTQTQIKTALDAYPAAVALISTAVTSGATVVTAPAGPASFTGGANPYGQAGSEQAFAYGSNIVIVKMEVGASTYQGIKTAIEANSAALAILTPELIGEPDGIQSQAYALQNFWGGENRYFEFNQDESSEDAYEGNGSVKVDDVIASGRMKVGREAEFESIVALKGALSGDFIPNAQQKINDIQDELDAHEAANTNVHGVGSGNQVVGTGTAQVLTNKDYDGGTASNTRRITVPKNTTTNLTALTRKEGTLVYDTLLKKVFYDDGTDLKQVGSGAGGIVRVDMYDPVTTVLPTTTAYLVDGQTIATDDLVLFDNLTTGSHRVYKAAVSAGAITWTVQELFTNGQLPLIGESIRVNRGTAYALSLGVYNSTLFEFNKTVRHFNGTDYFEQSAIISVAIAASSTLPVFTIGYASSENIIVEFSIFRGSTKEVGTLHITTNGTIAVMSQSGVSIGSSGISFNATIVGANLVLSYTSDASGTGVIKFMTRRWANASGGPAGLPSYGAGVPVSIPAAGSNGQVQFNSGGSLGADSGLTYDSSTNTMGMNGLDHKGLVSTSLLDNQPSPQDIFNYSATTYPFTIIEYSLIRDSSRRMGRIMLNSNGTVVSQTDDNNDIGSTGVVITSAVVSGNVVLRYTSTNTGFATTMKYSMRRWA